MQRTSWLAVCILLQELLWTRTIAQTVTAQACFQTDDQIRSSFASMYSEVVINCLSVAPSGSVNKVILSAFNSSNNVTARFTVTCVGSVLVSIPSPLIANRSSIGRGCSVSCVDTNQPCSAPCDPVCARCVGSGPSGCTSCASAKLANGTCTTSCPLPHQQPNPDMDMLCQCTGLYSGSTCQDCTACAPYGQPDVNCTKCTCGTLFTGPTCKICTSAVVLNSYVPRVPGFSSSIVSKRDASSSRGLLHDIRRRAAAEGPVFTGCLSPNPSTRPPFVREDATCCSSCAGGYLTASFNVCYACGIDYCTLCQQVDGVSQCLQCRDPLVVSVNKSLCLTTAEYQSDPCLVQNELFRLEELAIEQRAEEAAEVRKQAIVKDRLAISLPVVCFMMILFCVLMSVFAHWRYPAHGHKRQHLPLPEPRSSHDSEHSE
ncbi:hypothetical protein EMCRGX_G028233 [Ephydatia muelleri]